MTRKLAALSRDAIRHAEGNCYVADAANFGPSDWDKWPGTSQLQLFENGIELGPAHTDHIQIETVGRGRFSHWKGALYFSSSDGSSCIDNNRLYQIAFETPRSADAFPISSVPNGTLLNLQQGITSYQYRGIDCFKCPFDLALYLRLLWEKKPRTILEFGTLRGGSALWFADMMTIFGIDGHVHSFDIAKAPDWVDPRITFHYGDVLKIANAVPAEWVATLPRPILVVEDAGHFYQMTLSVLRHLGPLLQRGEYLIVEDGITHELGSDFEYQGGPRRALEEFLRDNKDFVVDRSLCDFYGENVTWNVNGYLRRV